MRGGRRGVLVLIRCNDQQEMKHARMRKFLAPREPDDYGTKTRCAEVEQSSNKLSTRTESQREQLLSNYIRIS